MGNPRHNNVCLKRKHLSIQRVFLVSAGTAINKPAPGSIGLRDTHCYCRYNGPRSIKPLNRDSIRCPLCIRLAFLSIRDVSVKSKLLFAMRGPFHTGGVLCCVPAQVSWHCDDLRVQGCNAWRIQRKTHSHTGSTVLGVVVHVSGRYDDTGTRSHAQGFNAWRTQRKTHSHTGSTVQRALR